MSLVIQEVDKRILDKNYELYGKDIAKYYFIEEASELIKELTKNMRGKENRADIVEELSDVYYTLSLLVQEFYISEDEINNNIRYKIARSKETMDIKD